MYPNNIDQNKIEYAMDADTFLLKAKEFPFDSHLLKGDTSFTLKIGANQDQVYTNMLILSVDTKAPKFMRSSFKTFAGTVGTTRYNNFATGVFQYWSFILEK
jgi:hypothetical protein